MEEYKENEKAFVYLDPPYLNSLNENNDQYTTSIDWNNVIIDHTNIYIDILQHEFLSSINDNAITDYMYKDCINQDYLKNDESTKNRRKKWN